MAWYSLCMGSMDTPERSDPHFMVGTDPMPVDRILRHVSETRARDPGAWS